MSRDDAQSVLNIMKNADTSCPGCAYSLMSRFVERFGFKNEAMAIFYEKFTWLEMPKEEGDYWYDVTTRS